MKLNLDTFSALDSAAMQAEDSKRKIDKKKGTRLVIDILKP